MDWAVFTIAGLATLAGAMGVILYRNTVHAALSLVMTLFAVAVLFVAQGAHFLAAVQVIVYAGAIVVLFLFVIMLLGVDRDEDIGIEPLKGQRPLAAITAGLVLLEVLLLARTEWATGAPSLAGPASGPGSNIEKLAASLFTRHVLAFEVTSVLLVIAVVGAVVLARRVPSSGLASGEAVPAGPAPPPPAAPPDEPRGPEERPPVAAASRPGPQATAGTRSDPYVAPPAPAPEQAPPAPEQAAPDQSAPAPGPPPAQGSSWVSDLAARAGGQPGGERRRRS